MNGTPFLSARHVTKTFGATQALRGVDIEILAGEMVAIVGPSGFGALNEKDAMSDFRVLYHAADRRRRHRRSAVCGGCEQPIMRGQ